MPRETRSTAPIALLLLAIALSICPPQRGRATEPAVVLSSLAPVSVEARSPCIVATPDGEAVAAWTEKPAGEERAALALRRRRGGRWEGAISPPDAIMPDASARDPALALGPDGTPHLAWVADRGDNDMLLYVALEEPGWSLTRPIAFTRARRIEPPHLAVSSADEGARFLVWQESEGTSYQIRAAVIETDGRPHLTVLEGLDRPRYVVFPEVFEMPGPPGEAPRMAVSWFFMEGSEPRLVLRVWNRAARRWDEVDTPAFDPRAVGALPLVLSGPDSGPWLVGHREFGPADRLFLSAPNGPEWFLDLDPENRNRYPRVGPFQDGRFAVGWEQRRDGKARLGLAVVEPRAALITRLPSEQTVINPTLSPEADLALTDSSVFVVWRRLALCSPGLPWQTARPSHTAAVFFQEFPRGASEPEKLLPVGEAAP